MLKHAKDTGHMYRSETKMWSQESCDTKKRDIRAQGRFSDLKKEISIMYLLSKWNETAGASKSWCIFLGFLWPPSQSARFPILPSRSVPPPGQRSEPRRGCRWHGRSVQRSPWRPGNSQIHSAVWGDVTGWEEGGGWVGGGGGGREVDKGQRSNKPDTITGAWQILSAHRPTSVHKCPSEEKHKPLQALCCCSN